MSGPLDVEEVKTLLLRVTQEMDADILGPRPRSVVTLRRMPGDREVREETLIAYHGNPIGKEQMN
jgi:hypothetical protein